MLFCIVLLIIGVDWKVMFIFFCKLEIVYLLMFFLYILIFFLLGVESKLYMERRVFFFDFDGFIIMMSEFCIIVFDMFFKILCFLFLNVLWMFVNVIVGIELNVFIVIFFLFVLFIVV